jgi:hypothetical protein
MNLGDITDGDSKQLRALMRELLKESGLKPCGVRPVPRGPVIRKCGAAGCRSTYSRSCPGHWTVPA